MALLWWVQVRIGYASNVDVTWATLIACAAIFYALLADRDAGQRPHRQRALATASTTRTGDRC